MKRALYLLFFLRLGADAWAQSLMGTYEGKRQKLTFTGDSVKYDLNTSGCITYHFYGKGVYHIVKNRLFIEPVLKKVTPFYLQPTEPKNRDTIYFTITDATDKTPIAGASVSILHNNKRVYGMATGKNGIAKFARSKIQSTDSVQVNFIAYLSATFKPNTDCSIAMVAGDNPEWHYAYVTNKGKGFQFKLKDNSLRINFQKQGSCGLQDWWVEFKKSSATL